MTLITLVAFATQAQGAGWVGPIALPGTTAASPQTVAVTRSGWLGAALSGSTPGTEQVLLRAPSGDWMSSTVPGVGTVTEAVVAVSERGDAVLAVANSSKEVLSFGHQAGGSGFVPLGTVLVSGYSSGTLGALALEDGTAAVTAATATDVVLGTGPVSGVLSTHSVLPPGTSSPTFPKLAANPRGDAILLFADHTATADRLDGLRRAPGGAFVPFAAPLDTLATATGTSWFVTSLALDDAGAAEETWLEINAGPTRHLRAGHLPPGATALSTPAAGRALRTASGTETVQGPIGAVPLPGESGAGVYNFVTSGPTNTLFDVTHAGAAGAYSGAAATGVTTGANALFVMPDPLATGGLAMAAIDPSFELIAYERHGDGTYAGGQSGLTFSAGTSVGAPQTDGADSILPVGQGGAKALIFDASPPVLGAPSGPTTAVAGTAAAFSVGAGDASGPPTVSWSFGDGGTATGASVSHAWATPGTYTIGVTATDALGQQSTQSRPVRVLPVPDDTAPKLTHVKLHPSSVKRPKARTTLKLTLSERATVTVTVTARVTGHRLGRKCRAGKPRYPHQKSCHLTKTELRLNKTLGAGPGSIALKLPRNVPTGRLAVRVSATDAAGNMSATSTLKLRVRR